MEGDLKVTASHRKAKRKAERGQQQTKPRVEEADCRAAEERKCLLPAPLLCLPHLSEASIVGNV